MPSELDLDTPPQPPVDRPRSSSAMAAVLVIFLVLFAAGGVTYYFLHRNPVPPPPAAESLAEAAAPRPAPPAPAPAVQLPPLESSDGFVREQLAGLGPAPWSEWLQSDGLARRFAALVAAIGEGKSPRQAFDKPSVSGRFAVVPADGHQRIAPESYARYDGVASTVAAIDATKAAAAYRLLHPLLAAAWSEIGTPGDTVDAAVGRAIDQLLATPDAPADAAVVMRDGLYRFEDPALESASAAQKHLLRMGPDNAGRIKTALRRFRAALG